MIESSGTYTWRIEGCPAGPTKWAWLEFVAETPGYSEIRFAARTADTLAELKAMDFAAVCSVPWDESPCNVSNAFEARGIVPGRILEIAIRLVPGAESPLLDELRLNWGCGF